MICNRTPRIRPERAAGFTLVEMLIAVGIFSLVSLLAVGAIVILFGAYNTSQSTQVLVDNLNFSIESMTRDVRFGKNYRDFEDGDKITVDFQGDVVTYELETVDGKGRIKRTAGTEVTYATTKDIDVESFQVKVDLISHPRATFLITGTLLRGNDESRFSLQTTVSQRENDASTLVMDPSGSSSGSGGSGSGGASEPTFDESEPVPPSCPYGNSQGTWNGYNNCWAIWSYDNSQLDTTNSPANENPSGVPWNGSFTNQFACLWNRGQGNAVGTPLVNFSNFTHLVLQESMGEWWLVVKVPDDEGGTSLAPDLWMGAKDYGSSPAGRYDKRAGSAPGPSSFIIEEIAC
ncbi:MAG: prepilin-type N-terminal cleavage/methylation domain-containing protein [Candidatus Paceibacterota bacterium]